MLPSSVFPIGKMKRINDCIALGRVVKAQRKGQRLTQIQAAGLSGVGLRFLHDRERGKSTLHLGKVIDVLATLGIRIHLAHR